MLVGEPPQTRLFGTKCPKEVGCVTAAIASVPIEDGQIRCVFRMFYKDGMTWEKIAARTGYRGNPDYPRLHIRDNYLKQCEIK